MPIDVTMPKLSDTMEEGTVLRWLKQVGDRVRPGDVIAEVETDKANMELEAYDEGVLAELRVGEKETVPVGAVIAVLAAPDEAAPGAGAPASPPPERAPETPRPAPSPSSTTPPTRPEPAGGEDGPREPWRPSVVRRPPERPAEAPRDVRASPLARKIAQEHGLDLGQVTGSGPGGRIVEKDVQAALAGHGAGESGTGPTPGPQVALRAEGRAVPTAPPPAGAARVDLGRMRRTTARRMAEAKREIPHFYASGDVDMDAAVALKAGLAAIGDAWTGLTYTHLVLKAVGLALRRVPELNASYDGEAMVRHEAVHVGLATAVGEGLLVPVVHDCDREPLPALVRKTNELVDRARSGRLAGDDLVGATFTVSNLGMFPVTEFAAIINPPQAAILAVATVREVPVVRDGAVVPGRRMTVTLSCDHRIVDGVLAGRFLREVKGLLEGPLALVV